MSSSVSTPTAFNLNFSYANHPPTQRAMLKGENAHFMVTEDLGFKPAGAGEHAYIELLSDGENTQWLAQQMANALGVKTMDIGFCGLKDRHAITRQWFSVYDPHRKVESNIEALDKALPNSQLCQVDRGATKLRRGQHGSNRFQITLVFDEIGQADSLEERLKNIQQQGVPNYFGLQRFGRDGGNLSVFAEWLAKQQQGVRQRKPKGIILSAARSYLFNLCVAERVVNQSWCDQINGDVIEMSLPTAPLWGRGRCATQGEALILEQQALATWQEWVNSLEHLGLQQERRVMVSKPLNFKYSWLSQQQLLLDFTLPPGQYATTLIRELCSVYEPAR